MKQLLQTRKLLVNTLPSIDNIVQGGEKSQAPMTSRSRPSVNNVTASDLKKTGKHSQTLVRTRIMTSFLKRKVQEKEQSEEETRGEGQPEEKPRERERSQSDTIGNRGTNLPLV